MLNLGNANLILVTASCQICSWIWGQSSGNRVDLIAGALLFIWCGFGGSVLTLLPKLCCCELGACSQGKARWNGQYQLCFHVINLLPPESTDWIVAWLPTKTYRTLMNCPPWSNVCIGHEHKSIISGLVIYKLWIRLVWILGMAIKMHKGENVQDNHFFMAYVHIQSSNIELLWGWCCLERELG